MLKGKRIGFIGAGNMGEALVKGIISAGLVKAGQVAVSDVSGEKLKHFKKQYGIQGCMDNRLVCKVSDVVLLAVKPQMMEAVLQEIGPLITARQTVISIAAGVRLAFLQKFFMDKVPVLRVMPNTPALVGQGMAVISRGKYAKAAHEQMALEIFRAVGQEICLPEAKLDAVTALSGSGPAYFFLMLEALRQAGVSVGLPKDIALRLATQTALGASTMALNTGDDPALLRERVTSKGGTTAAALRVLEKRGFNKIIVEAVGAACKRSKELGRS